MGQITRSVLVGLQLDAHENKLGCASGGLRVVPAKESKVEKSKGERKKGEEQRMKAKGNRALCLPPWSTEEWRYTNLLQEGSGKWLRG